MIDSILCKIVLHSNRFVPFFKNQAEKLANWRASQQVPVTHIMNSRGKDILEFSLVNDFRNKETGRLNSCGRHFWERQECAVCQHHTSGV